MRLLGLFCKVKSFTLTMRMLYAAYNSWLQRLIQNFCKKEMSRWHKPGLGLFTAGAPNCSGLLIPDTDLGENPRRERGV